MKLKIDKLGFYRRADGDECEIIFFYKPSICEFIAVSKHCYMNVNPIDIQIYTNEQGYHRDPLYCLVEFLRPSGVEWPTPRKISFVGYLDENIVDNFNIKDPDCIKIGLRIAEPDNPPGKFYRKISKWRFYGEELLGE